MYTMLYVNYISVKLEKNLKKKNTSILLAGDYSVASRTLVYRSALRNH